jgi:hypothetical protein
MIFGPLLGESAFEQPGGLADFDHVAVGAPHVAADLGTVIDRWGHFLQHDLAAEDVGVERAGPSNVSHGDELGDEETVARGGQVFEVDGFVCSGTVLGSSYAFWIVATP